jgi:hypothetical protein
MALTLLAAITATQTTFDVLGADDLQPGDFRTIDSETITIRTANLATPQYGVSARQRVTAYRGSAGTREAAHSSGSTVAAYSAGGSGSILFATTQLSTAQIMALDVTPVDILPALTGRNSDIPFRIILH